MEIIKIKLILKKLSRADREFCIKEICKAIEVVADSNYMNSCRQGRDDTLTSLFKSVASLADIELKKYQ